MKVDISDLAAEPRACADDERSKSKKKKKKKKKGRKSERRTKHHDDTDGGSHRGRVKGDESTIVHARDNIRSYLIGGDSGVQDMEEDGPAGVVDGVSIAEGGFEIGEPIANNDHGVHGDGRSMKRHDSDRQLSNRQGLQRTQRHDSDVSDTDNDDKGNEEGDDDGDDDGCDGDYNNDDGDQLLENHGHIGDQSYGHGGSQSSGFPNTNLIDVEGTLLAAINRYKLQQQLSGTGCTNSSSGISSKGRTTHKIVLSLGQQWYDKLPADHQRQIDVGISRIIDFILNQ